MESPLFNLRKVLISTFGEDSIGGNIVKKIYTCEYDYKKKITSEFFKQRIEIMNNEGPLILFLRKDIVVDEISFFLTRENMKRKSS